MNKPYLLLTFPLIMILFFVSCQKETSVENAGSGANTALFSLNGGTGSCNGASVSGSFIAGTAVTAANTVAINVNVDSMGSYDISSNAINGISFTGAGVFTSKGLQTITLNAIGTPATAGIFSFTPVKNGCTFSVTVAASNGGTNGAVYSFNGGSSTCTGALVNGIFTAGTATSSANAVALKVQVEKAGTYTINTNALNGIKFSGTGSFTTTGAQTVILTASGTPTTSGSFTFTPGANGCTFIVSVASAGLGGGAGGGIVGGSGNFLRCRINGVLTNFNTRLVGYSVPPPGAGIPFSISVQGKKSDVANSMEELWVSVTNPTAPTIGIYNNRTFSTGTTDRASQVAHYPTGFPNAYWSSSVLTDNTLTVNIKSVSATGATGTFQGTIYESNGGGPSTKNVTDGEFKITF